MPKLALGKRTAILPIVQGGMGVGISLSGLATAVAEEGGIGVIAANAIGMIEPDYYADGRAANIRALRREIRQARARTAGMIGVNIMVAVNDFPQLLETAISEKVDILFLGAGLPIKGIPVKAIRAAGTEVAPIVSSRRAAELIFKYWEKAYQDVPDAVVVEGPLAGGHLGFKPEQLDDPAFALEKIVPEVVAAVAPFQKAFHKTIPVIAAGGIFSGQDIWRFLQLGAQGVQMATRFVATHECDADQRFKDAYVTCRREDLTIIKSPVGMPGRAIRNRFLDDAAAGIRNVTRCAWRCLESCDIKNSVYCISAALNHARQGQLEHGFAFAGANAYRVERIVSVRELLGELKVEYEAALIKSFTTLKEEYLNVIDRGFASLHREYERARQRVDRRWRVCSQAWGKKIVAVREEYEKAAAHWQTLKKEYDGVIQKLNVLKVQFPERLLELQAIIRRYPAVPDPF